MKISVLQQKPRVRYNPQVDAPDFSVLEEKCRVTLDDTFAMLEEAGKRGSDLAVTIEGINQSLQYTDSHWPFPEVYEGDGPLMKHFSSAHASGKCISWPVYS